MIVDVKFWVYIQNQYDGAATARFYKTQQEAEKEASKCSERYCDDVYPQTLIIDTETGELVPYLIVR